MKSLLRLLALKRPRRLVVRLIACGFRLAQSQKLFPGTIAVMLSRAFPSDRSVARNRRVGASVEILAADPERRQFAANAVEYFGSRRGRQKLFVDHLVNDGLNHGDRERPGQGNRSSQFGDLFLKLPEALVRREHSSSLSMVGSTTIVAEAGGVASVPGKARPSVEEAA